MKEIGIGVGYSGHLFFLTFGQEFKLGRSFSSDHLVGVFLKTLGNDKRSMDTQDKGLQEDIS